MCHPRTIETRILWTIQQESKYTRVSPHTAIKNHSAFLNRRRCQVKVCLDKYHVIDIAWLLTSSGPLVLTNSYPLSNEWSLFNCDLLSRNLKNRHIYLALWYDLSFVFDNQLLLDVLRGKTWWWQLPLRTDSQSGLGSQAACIWSSITLIAAQCNRSPILFPWS